MYNITIAINMDEKCNFTDAFQISLGVLSLDILAA